MRLRSSRSSWRAVDNPTGDGFITEHFCDLIALEARELAAACFLRAEPMAFLQLRDAGDAGIDDGSYGVGFWFG